jgi:hypothetical protein
MDHEHRAEILPEAGGAPPLARRPGFVVGIRSVHRQHER